MKAKNLDMLMDRLADYMADDFGDFHNWDDYEWEDEDWAEFQEDLRSFTGMLTDSLMEVPDHFKDLGEYDD